MPSLGQGAWGETVIGIRPVRQQGAGSYKVQKCVKDFKLSFAISEKLLTGSKWGSPLGKVTVAVERTASWR